MSGARGAPGGPGTLPDPRVVAELALDAAIDLSRLRTSEDQLRGGDELLDLALALCPDGSSVEPGSPPGPRSAAATGSAAAAWSDAAARSDGAKDGILALPSPRRPGAVRRGAAVAVAAAVTAVAGGVALVAAQGAGSPTPPVGGRLQLVQDTTAARFSGPGAGAGGAMLNGMACATPRACTAVAGAPGHPVAAASADGGRTWVPATLPPATSSLVAISCASPATCWAAGTTVAGGPLLLASGDAGSTWRTVPLPPGVTSLAAVDCPAPTACWAGGTAHTPSGSTTAWVLRSHGASSLSAATVPVGLDSITALSCSSATACWAGGNTTAGVAVTATTNAGANWRTVPLGPAGTSSGTSGGTSGGHPGGRAVRVATLTCPTPATCWATVTSTAGTTPATLAVWTGRGGDWHGAASREVGRTGAAGFSYRPACAPACGDTGSGATLPPTGAVAALLGSAVRAAPPGPAGVLACTSTTQCWVVQSGTTGVSAVQVPVPGPFPSRA